MGQSFNMGAATGFGAKSVDPEVEKALAELAPIMCSHHFSMEEAEASQKQLRYVIGYNGISVMQAAKLNGNTVQIIQKTDKLPGLPTIEPSLKFTPEHKLPKDLLRTVLAAFKAVYDRDATEAAAQIYRKQDGEYVIYYPEQENSGAQSTYKNDKKATEELRREMDFIMELHSHSSFGAFFSGTDNANENLLLYYCVLGMFGSNKANFVGRIKVGDLSLSLSIGDIFEGATDEDLKLADLPTEFGDILTKAKKHTYVYTPPVRDVSSGRFRSYNALANAPDKDDEIESEYYRVIGADRYKDWSPRKHPNPKKQYTRSANVKLSLEWLVSVMSDEDVTHLLTLLERRPKQ